MNLSTARAARPLFITGLCLLVAASLLGGCSINEYVAEKTAIDYKSAGKRAPLDIPPDLVTPGRDERFAIPEVAEQTFSGYQSGKAASPGVAPASSAVLPALKGARIERLGQQRWLMVSLPPERVWPQVREFWQENGFLIQSESPATGIIETDWAENRAKLPQDVIRRTIGSLVDSLYSTGERDKFRTRLERVPGGTEIYITNRRMVEVYSDKMKESTVWQPQAGDPELEVEFMRRLLVKLGASADEAKGIAVADATAVAGTEVRLVTGPDGASSVEIGQSFDRAWRLVGVALDRAGFTVEDRDRSKGIYFVRYIDPESESRNPPEQGFFSRLFSFGGKDAAVAERFQVRVKGAGEQVSVTVHSFDGKDVAAGDKKTATRLLTVLHEQLK